MNQKGRNVAYLFVTGDREPPLGVRLSSLLGRAIGVPFRSASGRMPAVTIHSYS